MKTNSKLEKILKTGSLAVTSECGPPRGAVPEKIQEKAGMLKGYVDAINVTDNQTAVVRMSSMAACIFIRQMGLNPILQMVTRDRNRLAMQSDILGAYSHGIDTMLCLSGDHPQFGDHPMAANVYSGLAQLYLARNDLVNARQAAETGQRPAGALRHNDRPGRAGRRQRSVARSLDRRHEHHLA